MPDTTTDEKLAIAAWVAPELKEKAALAADATERSMSAYLRHALRQQLRADQRALGRLGDD